MDLNDLTATATPEATPAAAPETTEGGPIKALLDEMIPDGEPESAAPADGAEPEGGTEKGGEAKPAEAAAEPEIAVSPAVLLAAGKAGLTVEEIAELGSDAAVTRAIAFAERQTAAVRPPAKEKAPEAASPDEEWPELAPLKIELPKALTDDEDLNPVIKEALGQLAQTVQQRDEVYRAELARLRQSATAPAPDPTSDPIRDMRLDMEFNAFVGKNDGWGEKLGNGFYDELSEAEQKARQDVANIAAGLAERQRDQGRRPRLGELIAQAAAIVFPEKQKQATKATLVKTAQSRTKVRQPQADKAPEDDLPGGEFVKRLMRDKGIER